MFNLFKNKKKKKKAFKPKSISNAMTNGTMTMLFGKQYSKDVNNFTAAEIYFLESCMKEIAGQTSRVMEVTMLLMGMREKTKDKPDSLDGTELDDSAPGMYCIERWFGTDGQENKRIIGNVVKNASQIHRQLNNPSNIITFIDMRIPNKPVVEPNDPGLSRQNAMHHHHKPWFSPFKRRNAMRSPIYDPSSGPVSWLPLKHPGYNMQINSSYAFTPYDNGQMLRDILHFMIPEILGTTDSDSQAYTLLAQSSPDLAMKNTSCWVEFILDFS